MQAEEVSKEFKDAAKENSGAAKQLKKTKAELAAVTKPLGCADKRLEESLQQSENAMEDAAQSKERLQRSEKMRERLKQEITEREDEVGKLMKVSEAPVESVKKARNARNVCKNELTTMTNDRDNKDAQLKICKGELLMRDGS